MASVLRNGRVAIDVVWRQRQSERLMRLPWLVRVGRSIATRQWLLV
jgi:hypothetical protein